MFSAYGTLFRIPGALRFSFAGFIGRMPIAMDNLALIFIVVDKSGSYALAGALSAVASIVVAMAGPFWARNSDRYGQGKILMRLAPIRIALFLLFVGLVTWGAPIWTWFICIIFAEMTALNAGGMVRRRWLHILKKDPALTEKHLVNSAYSLEALVDEIVFILGPVVATFCATRISPAAGIIAAVIFIAIGLPALAVMKSTEPPPIPRSLEEPHPPVLSNKRVQSVVFPCVLIGGFFGAMGITVVGFAQERGAENVTGLVLAIWALGSATSALISGVIHWKKTHAALFLIFLVGLFLASLPLLFVHSILALSIGLFLNGFFVAPLIINAYGVAENAVPSGQITETLAWVVAGMPLGGAVSSAIAGWVIDTHGAQAAYWVPIAFSGAAILATAPYFSTYRAAIGYDRHRD
ncbi:unannotated protein [freshwater metagenome]|uniref:Unannotated protein n=1 Tax=freshwater metagenome TaxID=449393 RepID=A0A6J7XS60_9ZZZZ|nr:MFS transporter [Actinomycetota bacterium]